ncbi:MAG TPA: M23 family metallopeptidase [Candidatus Limnocylindrales bacterium]|nr:M23 family metallopeptidase [Candidatus Limnocylindrales bacterium]
MRRQLARLASRPAVAPRHRDAHPATIVDRVVRTARGAARTFEAHGARDAVLRGASHPRALPAGVTALVVAAALVSVTPSTIGHSPDPSAAGETPRIVAFAGALRGAAPVAATGGTAVERAHSSTGREVQLRYLRAMALKAGGTSVEGLEALGPFDETGPTWDGAPPMVPEVPLVTYRVRSGDTIIDIAHRFHVRMATIWWANGIRSATNLHVGQKLVIPQLDGRVVTVRKGDTLQSIARTADVDEAVIVAANGLGPGDVAVGQKLFVPGDVQPLPQPKVRHKPTARATTTSHTTRSSAPSGHISGGWAFPVVGGGAYISQYFHASHPALDIAADYGTPVRAAHSGTVIFAGWKNNGGGWQVWMSHGGNIYTTYNHMSALTVHAGQSLGAGQQVGRVGQSGWATGPHCHFEVWIGRIWDGGTRVNPLNYV